MNFKEIYGIKFGLRGLVRRDLLRLLLSLLAELSKLCIFGGWMLLSVQVALYCMTAILSLTVVLLFVSGTESEGVDLLAMTIFYVSGFAMSAASIKTKRSFPPDGRTLMSGCWLRFALMKVSKSLMKAGGEPEAGNAYGAPHLDIKMLLQLELMFAPRVEALDTLLPLKAVSLSFTAMMSMSLRPNWTEPRN